MFVSGRILFVARGKTVKSCRRAPLSSALAAMPSSVQAAETFDLPGLFIWLNYVFCIYREVSRFPSANHASWGYLQFNTAKAVLVWALAILWAAVSVRKKKIGSLIYSHELDSHKDTHYLGSWERRVRSWVSDCQQFPEDPSWETYEAGYWKALEYEFRNTIWSRVVNLFCNLWCFLHRGGTRILVLSVA